MERSLLMMGVTFFFLAVCMTKGLDCSSAFCGAALTGRALNASLILLSSFIMLSLSAFRLSAEASCSLREASSSAILSRSLLKPTLPVSLNASNSSSKAVGFSVRNRRHAYGKQLIAQKFEFAQDLVFQSGQPFVNHRHIHGRINHG